MKRSIRHAAVLILGFSLLLLCSCSYESKFVGTWVGDGTLDVRGGVTSYEYATQFVFRSDGTATATVNGNEVQYQYSASDDSLTLREEGVGSHGMPYTIKGNTLTITTGGGSYAVFTKTN